MTLEVQFHCKGIKIHFIVIIKKKKKKVIKMLAEKIKFILQSSIARSAKT